MGSWAWKNHFSAIIIFESTHIQIFDDDISVFKLDETLLKPSYGLFNVEEIAGENQFRVLLATISYGKGEPGKKSIKKISMAPPGFEPKSICAWNLHSNHYTTQDLLDEKLKSYL